APGDAVQKRRGGTAGQRVEEGSMQSICPQNVVKDAIPIEVAVVVDLRNVDRGTPTAPRPRDSDPETFVSIGVFVKYPNRRDHIERGRDDDAGRESNQQDCQDATLLLEIPREQIKHSGPKDQNDAKWNDVIHANRSCLSTARADYAIQAAPSSAALARTRSIDVTSAAHMGEPFVTTVNERPCPVCQFQQPSGTRIIPQRKDMSGQPLRLSTCGSCGAVYQPAVPGLEALTRWYDYMGQHVENVTLTPLLERRLGRILDRLQEHRRTTNLLEVGCGGGLLLRVAAAQGWNT